MCNHNRFSMAHMIQQGASNPVGIARSLVEAIDEARAENQDTRTDPAVRMIVHHLAFVLNLSEYEFSPDAYGRDYKICQDHANA